MSSIDVGSLLVCVLGRGHGLDFPCLAAAVAMEAAGKTRIAATARSVPSYF